MATPAEVQAALDASGRRAKILRASHAQGTTKEEYYVQGGVTCASRARWVVCTASDNAATQASTIFTKLRA